MNLEVKDFLVYLIELCAEKYFNGNELEIMLDTRYHTIWGDSEKVYVQLK